ncbi:MAG: 8-oxo-dGTP diphosphatase [Lachnospiraceae bacterium]|nr:8-oxo-dGTP diphosphatase [Lachnospiraceae bacterium]
MKNTTLIYLKKENKYLMMFRNKKDDDPNMGKWIGVGGRIEEGETPKECAMREIYEETGLVPYSITFRGIVFFINTLYETEYMFLYTSDDLDPEATGDKFDCDEGTLEWVDLNKIDEINLWEGDRFFLKLLEDGAPPFFMTLKYEGDKLTDHDYTFI